VRTHLRVRNHRQAGQGPRGRARAARGGKPNSARPQDARPIRSENRAILVASIARGRRWLDELTADPTANTESIAGREGCSVRKVNMTISLAFLAPDLVKAAIDGRLPHGMGAARLCDLPADWSRQRQMLGLAAL
jgi:site-specific DNA recombinase